MERELQALVNGGSSPERRRVAENPDYARFNNHPGNKRHGFQVTHVFGDPADRLRGSSNPLKQEMAERLEDISKSAHEHLGFMHVVEAGKTSDYMKYLNKVGMAGEMSPEYASQWENTIEVDPTYGDDMPDLVPSKKPPGKAKPKPGKARREEPEDAEEVTVVFRGLPDAIVKYFGNKPMPYTAVTFSNRSEAFAPVLALIGPETAFFPAADIGQFRVEYEGEEYEVAPSGLEYKVGELIHCPLVVSASGPMVKD
jgi:hypothetical protein